jgi:hypothetical protein
VEAILISHAFAVVLPSFTKELTEFCLENLADLGKFFLRWEREGTNNNGKFNMVMHI